MHVTMFFSLHKSMEKQCQKCHQFMFCRNEPQEVIRSLWGCEKWVPDKILHRNMYPDFFPGFIFSIKKSNSKIPIGENRGDPKGSNGEHAHKS